jgi:ATP-dependent DNA helicase RecG
MKVDAPIHSVKGVGESVARKFEGLGIETVRDLLEYYPRKYDDYSEVRSTISLKPGTNVTIRATIKQVKGRYVRRGMHITEAIASDETGSVRLVWFNQPYRAASIKPHQHYFISGSFELSRQKLAIMNPSMELESAFPINTARIVAIYKETKGLTSSGIRKLLSRLRGEIVELPETLPKNLVESNGLMSRSEAIMAIHFPSDVEELARAKERLSFEELFAVSLAGFLNKQQFANYSGVPIPFNKAVAQSFVNALDYSLTDAQRKAAWQVYKDLEASRPMNRLIEGDVGSGKTLVAAMAAAMAMQSGYQVALMAPTEILAQQHAKTMHNYLDPIGFSNKLVLLLGSMKEGQKKTARKSIADGLAGLVIGTHALIADKVDMHKLGLVIIDEQHRFGVEQRERLLKKAGLMPHVLTMTATPIPRTLALTLYGELDISIIDELPPGRAPIKTAIVSPNSRGPMYSHVREQLKKGRQVFVVCPLISQSQTIPQLSVEVVFEDLSKKVFSEFRVGLLHGKQKSALKEKIMQDFVDGSLDILVLTTVIEVGVDVPNATIMLIEGAERFGLAQVHQLRGRVGRGAHGGTCFLVMSDSQAPPARIKALETIHDGFKLAELDLEIRGPGAIYGRAQHGQLDLRIANLSDVKLISRVREAAEQWVEKGVRLDSYPELKKQVDQYRRITNLN